MEKHDTPPRYGDPIKSHGLTISPRVGFPVLAVVLLALSFFGGVQYQKSKHTNIVPASATSQAKGRLGAVGGFRHGNRAGGSVTAVSATSITVDNRAGTSKTYVITSATTVTNAGQAGSVGDIKVGDRVFITVDTTNAQNAASIALNPSFGSGGAHSTAQPDSSSNGTNDNSSI